jgi:glycosyltransferase involved in cell wall biosynthesis
MLHLPHALLTNSIKARTNLATLGLSPDKVFVLPNVIDLKDFDLRKAEPLDLPLPHHRPVAVAAGRLHPDKRFERFLEALALARITVPELYGVLAGRDDGAMDSLQKRARDLGLTPDHLCFAGECSNIPTLLGHATFLVLSSAVEGLPNIVLEAMAAGLPIVSTPAGDAPHIVRHGKSGFVVDFDDVPAMAESMVTLAQSPALRQAMGQAGRQMVESEYEFGSLRSRALRLFQTVAEKRNNKPSLQAFRTLEPAQ